MITYHSNKALAVKDFIELLRRSTLGERRPIDDTAIMAARLAQADVLISAWAGDSLVGVARTLTDYHYVAYLADLAVDSAYQRRGIGKELITRTRAALKPSCLIVLLAAPMANDYYPKLGFVHNPRAWMLPPPCGPKRK